MYAKYLKECMDERPTTFQVEYARVVLDVAGLKLEDQADSDPEVSYQKDENQVSEDLHKRLSTQHLPSFSGSSSSCTTGIEE